MGYLSIHDQNGGLDGGSEMAGIRTRNRLKALSVEKESTPGTYADGGGLSLIVTDTGRKKWELRIAVGRRRRQLGLGVYPSVSLEDARSKAMQIRSGASEGRDMVAEEKQAKRLAAAPTRSITFRAAFDGYFEMKEQQLSNEKHKAQWRSTMEAYVFPSIGKRPVGEIAAAEVIDILKPIWNTKRETARRVLQRMRAVFEAAIVRGERQRASPTVGIATVLGSRNLRRDHHPAMPYTEVPAFITRLRSLEGWIATRLAFEFLILTASRSGEVRLANWSEIDLDNALWTVPADRMKARVEHAVPLAPRAIALLREARANYPKNELVFPGTKPGLPLSDMTLTKVLRDAGLAGKATTHGFRSSFKDWSAEVAKARDEVSEAALAHKTPDKVRAAYLRTRFLGERRQLMLRWARYLERTERKQ
jgi:integrase